MRVYVNERAVEVPAGAPALTAVAALDGELGAAITEGRAYLTFAIDAIHRTLATLAPAAERP